jgi:20S proteasome alpha/beta subunit
MTLILCLKGIDGMVLASDSRGTFGDPKGVTAQNDTQKKVYRLTKFSGMLIAGSGEIGAMVHGETRARPDY